MKKDITGNIILITGGGKGIGREIARIFAQHDNSVIITGRTEPALMETTKIFTDEGYDVSYHIGDVTSREDCHRIVDAVVQKFGRIDILINNAGMSSRGFFEDTSLDAFEKIIDINFMGAVNMTKFALPTIQQNKGSIVFIGSLSGLKGLPGIAPYGTAKMALTGFSDSLRSEVYPDGVHIGILYVGFTENDQNKTVYDAEGNLIPIPARKNFDTQENVAKAVYRCVEQRKSKLYLTAMGKAANFLYRIFPRQTDAVLVRYGTVVFPKDSYEDQ